MVTSLKVVPNWYTVEGSGTHISVGGIVMRGDHMIRIGMAI